MPTLNSRQFFQDPLEGFYSSEVQGIDMPGWHQPRPRRPEDAPPHDPGPITKRGVVGQGQQVMNFDVPDRQLEVGTGGLVPIDLPDDPDWDDSAWVFAGGYRVNPKDRSPHFGPLSPDPDEVVTAGWERAPVETIGPDAEIRTNQIDELNDSPQTSVWVEPDRVEELRDEGDLAFQDPDTGTEQFPWVAEVAGKRYLLEGHHRTIAARTRGDGSFPAHVLRGGNFGQIEQQLYDGPWER